MKTETRPLLKESGSTLVVTISVVATILVLLGSAVGYTSHISRVADRSRKASQALEIGDGHLEYLFSSWRNISRAPGFRRISALQPPTHFFFTQNYNPGPAPSTAWTTPWPGAPPIIPRPLPSSFPNIPDYAISQYRIQAVNPMIELTANETSTLAPNAFPSFAYGPNTWQYSVFYLAAVDVTIPSMRGNVSAKVRRIFEKKYDDPWTFGMFYHDDLELHPTTALNLNGPIHTNGGLYIGTNKVTASTKVTYASEYVNGQSPKDTTVRASAPTEPNFAKSDPSLAESDCPPAQESPYLPFGWILKLQNADGTVNNDSYREIIERPSPTTLPAVDDPLGQIRYYHQPGIRVLFNADNSVQAFVVNEAGVASTMSSSQYNSLLGNQGNGSSTGTFRPAGAFYDVREGTAVSVIDIDISKLVSLVGTGSTSGITGWTGVLYVSDARGTTYNPDGTVKTAGTPINVTVNGVPYTTTKRAFRLVNGTNLPSPGTVTQDYTITGSTALTVKPGLTFVSDNPVYILGNYNTGGNPPSNSGTPSQPTVSGYTRRQAAVVADSITVLSTAWQGSANQNFPGDTNSNAANGLASRVAANTTINAALLAGNVPSGGGFYSGGGENHIRLLEDWNNKSLTYYGSMVQLYNSAQGIGKWNGDGVYVAPLTNRYYWDSEFAKQYNHSHSTAKFWGSPPGKLSIAAYLQQQRWYQVY